jgi:lipoyl(octanoyl) transferase
VSSSGTAVNTDPSPAWAPRQLRRDQGEPLLVVRPGTLDYREAWELQRQVVAARQAEAGKDVLFLLEHPRVYTLGRRTDRAHVLFDEAERDARGIEVVEVDRGGDVTYHGPGQLVGYPVLRLASLRGVVDYVRTLEEVLIRVLATYDVVGERVADLTGVWVGNDKIAAIGVRVASKGVTSHGFALNVTSDLDDFAGIVPCGIVGRGVCSFASLGIDTTVDEVADRVELTVADVFGATLEATSLDSLGRSTTPTA